jgi:hypothetical protein
VDHISEVVNVTARPDRRMRSFSGSVLVQKESIFEETRPSSDGCGRSAVSGLWPPVGPATRRQASLQIRVALPHVLVTAARSKLWQLDSRWEARPAGLIRADVAGDMRCQFTDIRQFRRIR